MTLRLNDSSGRSHNLNRSRRSCPQPDRANPLLPAATRAISPLSHSSSSSFSSRPNLLISVPLPYSLPNSANGMGGSASSNGKSSASLEKEIMHLQDVLKERGAEIVLLEGSLKAAESKANSFPTPLPTSRPTVPQLPHLPHISILEKARSW